MSESPKWTIEFGIAPVWRWKPSGVLDNESNYIIAGCDWLCFTISGSWRK